MSEPILKIRGLTAGYGDVQVLWGIDMDVMPGSITCVIGSNGAGKSTLMRTISGLVKANSGEIEFCSSSLKNAAPKDVLRAGIAHVPEGRRLFKGLSVEDNLLIGAYCRDASKHDIAKDLDHIYRIFPKLKERYKQDATTLSGGEQQMCAIGRGIMSKPKLLIIDELSLGLAPRAVELLSESLQEINKEGLAILIVEQDVYTALDLSQFGYVIETGRVAFSGLSAELIHNQEIKKAYLGI